MKLKIGDKVTNEPDRYFDGTLVAGWPNLHYVGIVRKLVKISGVDYASVNFSGRMSYENIDKLKIVTGENL
jgi:hypothetical protein